LSLRSFEYAFMPASIYEDQPTRNPLLVVTTLVRQ
jgi:hypothetical protein